MTPWRLSTVILVVLALATFGSFAFLYHRDLTSSEVWRYEGMTCHRVGLSGDCNPVWHLLAPPHYDQHYFAQSTDDTGAGLGLTH